MPERQTGQGMWEGNWGSLWLEMNTNEGMGINVCIETQLFNLISHSDSITIFFNISYQNT